MAKVISDKDQNKKDLEQFNATVNKFLQRHVNSRGFYTYSDLVDLARALLDNFGGQVMPYDDPDNEVLGFVWKIDRNGTETAANPVIIYDHCMEHQVKDHMRNFMGRL